MSFGSSENDERIPVIARGCDNLPTLCGRLLKLLSKWRTATLPKAARDNLVLPCRRTM
jgi:hypothetical protein